VYSSDSLFTRNGTKIYSARVIPFKGAWMEFATDINNVMYAYIDRKKKFPVTMLLRAVGYDSDKDILKLFDLADEITLSSKKECRKPLENVWLHVFYVLGWKIS
jgi:DNA-directed RNA polymerase subunit beta